MNKYRAETFAERSEPGTVATRFFPPAFDRVDDDRAFERHAIVDFRIEHAFAQAEFC